MRRSSAIVTLTLLVGCKSRFPLYCDENTPCQDTSLVCDLRGDTEESEGIGHVCVHPVDDTPDAPALDTPPGFSALLVEPNGSGSGHVTSMPDGIDCGTICSANFANGTEVTLSAAADSATSTFLGWSGACEGLGACTVVMNGNQQVGAKFGVHGEKVWLKQIGGMGSDGAADIALDGNGDVIVVGSFSEPLLLDGTELAPVPGGTSDIIVAKLSGSTGSRMWAKSFGAGGNDSANAVAVDAAGDVYIAGDFYGTVSFDGNVVTASDRDAFAAKLSGTDGSSVWAKGFGGPAQDYGNGIDVDSSGVPTVLGTFQGTATFDDAMVSSNGGSEDVFFIRCHSTDGHRVWLKTYGGAGMDRGHGIGVDGSGNVVVTGAFTGTANFGGVVSLMSAGSSDIFLAKYASGDGAHLWSDSYGSTGTETGAAVGVDGDNSVLLTGYFSDSVDFGGPSPLMSSGGEPDAFVAKFTTSGAHVWSRGFGGAANDIGLAVTSDPFANVYVTGYFQQTADFGGGPLSSAGDSIDVFAAKYAPDSLHAWSYRLGGTSGDQPRGVAGNASGVVFSGYFNGFSDFVGEELTASGPSDMFVIKFVP